ncbi:MAG: hybrid sensor histidine kinase/response regulator [Pirellulaceae bacterium]|nr:hybrid sensor histidine kinase/response regulator [Planctomycetales bacterium]
MRILLIEDNPGDAELVRKALSDCTTLHELQWVTRLRDAIDNDTLNRFNVILADLSLPDSSGLDTVKKLRSVYHDFPIIVLTSLANDSVAIEAIKEGAQDYLVKDQVDSDRLERSVRYAVQRQRMRAENDRLLRDLQDSKTMLERKNQRLERLCETAQQFVDNVSHEFRTPLTVIMEYASLLREGITGEVNDEQRRLLAVIDDRAGDLNTMVDDMLDVSKLESGLLGAYRKECRLHDIVAHVLPSLQRKADVRSACLETAIPDDLPSVYCDAEKVGRVIVNLVVNAIKFSRVPGAVRLWAELSDEHEVRIGVTDNGPGIPPDRLEEIFQRFSQLNTELRQSNKGFGLGLNIAQELVGINLGKMRVESQQKVGSTFTFTLPLAGPVRVTERYLDWLRICRDASPAVSVVRVGMADPVSATTCHTIDTFLSLVVRQKDLVFRRADGEWLLLVNTPEIELPEFRRRFDQEHRDISRNSPRGPLPQLTFQADGSWDVDDQRHEILGCVASYLETQEVCHV